jgi:hypothetical protein
MQNVFVNVVIYVLPIFPVWTIQTSVKRRLKLIAMFTLGFAAVSVSLLRFIVLWQLSNTTDTSYVFGSVTIITSVEFAVAIITANSPGIAMFWKAIVLKRPIGTHGASGSHGTPGTSDGLRMGNLSHVGKGGLAGGGSASSAYGKKKFWRRSQAQAGTLSWTDSEEELRPSPSPGNVTPGSIRAAVQTRNGENEDISVNKTVVVTSKMATKESFEHEAHGRVQPREYYEFGR